MNSLKAATRLAREGAPLALYLSREASDQATQAAHQGALPNVVASESLVEAPVNAELRWPMRYFVVRRKEDVYRLQSAADICPRPVVAEVLHQGTVRIKHEPLAREYRQIQVNAP